MIVETARPGTVLSLDNLHPRELHVAVLVEGKATAAFVLDENGCRALALFLQGQEAEMQARTCRPGARSSEGARP